MIYTVTLNPSVDYTMYTEGLTLGQTNRSCREQCSIGGKGINVSKVLHELGVPSTALGFVAGFTGQAIEEDVRRQGIATRFIRLSEGMSRINVKLRAEVETELNGQGPPVPSEAVAQMMTMLSEPTDGDILVLAGSVPPSVQQDIYRRIMAQAAGSQVRCVVDAARTLLLETLPHKPFLIKPNKQELEELFETSVTSEEDIVGYAQELRRMGAANVLVSMGADGAVLLDEQGRIHRAKAIPCRAVSTVGAGDSMVAGFLAGYAASGDYAQALRWGTICGAATASLSGLATKQRIDELAAVFPSD